MQKMLLDQRRFLRYAPLIALILLVVYKINVFITENDTTSNDTNTETATLVLAWSNLHSETPWENINPPLFKNCPPELNCEVTSDRTKINQSAAVLFHLAANDWRDLVPFRRADQYFVFAMWEPPTYENADVSDREDFFNLTITYRKDADVVWPYASFRRKIKKIDDDFDRLKRIVSNKSKLAAQMVSVCRTPSRRENFVKEMQKHIEVDVYGRCSDKKCPQDPNRNPTSLGTKGAKPCDKMLITDYKFYLSFENSLCKDYVTEKFFERMDNAFIVPVVLERNIILEMMSIDKEATIVLNKSFIAADDFENARQLGDYLKYLDKNTSAYLEYFEWRRNYEVIFEDDFKPGCELCRILTEKKRRVVENLKDWWITKAVCHSFKQSKA